jgi:hypothetical protein
MSVFQYYLFLLFFPLKFSLRAGYIFFDREAFSVDFFQNLDFQNLSLALFRKATINEFNLMGENRFYCIRTYYAIA